MSGHDISTAPVPLEVLIEAAKTASPISPEGLSAQSKLAGHGLLKLQDLHDRLFALPNKEARAEAIAATMADDAAVFALASSWQIRNGEVEALITKIKTQPGSSVPANRLLAVIRRRCSEMGKEKGRRLRQRSIDRSNEHFKALGLPGGIVCPEGYDIDRQGVHVVSFKDGEEHSRPICHAPLVISKRTYDVSSGSHQLEVAWLTKNQWVKKTVPKEAVMDGRKLIALSGKDAPVTSANAGEVVKFLSAFEAVNIERLPEEGTTWKLGWHEQDFVLPGRVYQRPNQVPLNLSLRENFGQLAEGFKKSGTIEGWTRVMEEYVLDRPIPLMMLYASIASPLLRVIGGEGGKGFIVDASGDTSLGKTTSLRVAASVWGLPDDMEGGIIKTWERTDVGLERMAGFLNSLPLMLDDTKHAIRDPERVSRAMYYLPAGQGKGRGTIAGVQETMTWRLITLSTGEAPITSFSEDGGARARCICLKGAPFGEDKERGAEATQAVFGGLMRHHGHVGPRLLTWLLAKKDWSGIRARYRERQELYQVKATDAVSGRLGNYMAVLHIAHDILHGPLGLPPAKCDPLGFAWQACAQGGAEADRAKEAMSDLYAYCCSRSGEFFGRNISGMTRGLLGVWHNNDDWKFIGIQKTLLFELLRSWKHRSPAGIIGSWKRRGWLLTDKGGITKQVKMGAGRPRLVVVSRSALLAEPVTSSEE